MDKVVQIEDQQLKKLVKIQKHRGAYFITWCLYLMSILAVIALIIDIRTETFPIWMIYAGVIGFVTLILISIYLPFQIEISKKKIHKKALAIEKKNKNTFYGFASSMLEESKMRAVMEEYMLFTSESCIFVDGNFYEQVNEGDKLDIYTSIRTGQIIEVKSGEYNTLDIKKNEALEDVRVVE